MPATNPRLTITLKPSTAALLRLMSSLTGNSQSALIAELLEANEPVFERLVKVLQAAKDAKAAVAQETRAGLDHAQRKLEKQLGLMLETMDEGVAPLLAEMETVKRRAKRRTGTGSAGTVRGVARRGQTPPSNRGVRSSPDKPKKSTKTRT